MPDPEDLLSELRFGVTGRPDFAGIRRQARRRRFRRIAMAAVPLSVVAALVVVPRLASDDGPPAAVVAFAPNGGPAGDGASPTASPGEAAPQPAPPATTTATTSPPTISTLVAEDEPEFVSDLDATGTTGEDPAGEDAAGDDELDVVTQGGPTTDVGSSDQDGAGDDGDEQDAAGAGPTTVPALAVEAAPPLETGSPIDDLATLPQGGFAVVQDGVTVLVDADGESLGHLPTGTSGLSFGRPTPVLPASAVTGCQVAESRRTLRVEICPRRVREHGATYDSREVRLSRIDAPSIVVTTPIGRDWYTDPSRPVLGRWRSAAVSPEARWMALEWVGSCGSVDAFVLDLERDELISATGTDWPVSPAAEVLGWADDDTLLLRVPDDPCSAMTAPPGVYRFRPADGSLDQLVTTDPAASAQLWSQAPVDQ